MADDDNSRGSIFLNSNESAVHSDSSASWSNYILQLLAIGLAVLFGVYTAISYPVAKDSLQQAEIANQLSLLSFCSAQAENSAWTVSCSDVLKNFNLTAVATVLLPPPASPGSNKGRGGLSSSQKIGLGVGLGFGLPAAFVVTFTFFIKALWVSLVFLVIPFHYYKKLFILTICFRMFYLPDLGSAEGDVPLRSLKKDLLHWLHPSRFVCLSYMNETDKLRRECQGRLQYSDNLIPRPMIFEDEVAAVHQSAAKGNKLDGWLPSLKDKHRLNLSRLSSLAQPCALRLPLQFLLSGKHYFQRSNHSQNHHLLQPHLYSPPHKLARYLKQTCFEILVVRSPLSTVTAHDGPHSFSTILGSRRVFHNLEAQCTFVIFIRRGQNLQARLSLHIHSLSDSIRKRSLRLRLRLRLGFGINLTTRLDLHLFSTLYPLYNYGAPS